jgi:hypothetical protein
MKDSILLITTIIYAVAVTQPNALAFRSISGVHATNTIEHKLSSISSLKAVPSSGIIDYIGRTVPTDTKLPRWSTDEMVFTPQNDKELFQTKLGLFRQYPWKRIRGKVILKAKISGSLPLESSAGGGFGFGGSSDLEPVDSLSDLQNLFTYACKDPRVQAVVLEIGKIECSVFDAPCFVSSDSLISYVIRLFCHDSDTYFAVLYPTCRIA